MLIKILGISQKPTSLDSAGQMIYYEITQLRKIKRSQGERRGMD